MSKKFYIDDWWRVTEYKFFHSNFYYKFEWWWGTWKPFFQIPFFFFCLLMGYGIIVVLFEKIC